jgi:hypothetical protein
MSIFAWISVSLVLAFILSTIDPRVKIIKTEKVLTLAIAGSVFGGVLSSVILGLGISAINLSSLFISILVSMQSLYFGKNIKILK